MLAWVNPPAEEEHPMVYLQLTAAQTFELRRFAQTAVGRVALRALMVLWRAEGHSTLEIAARLGCHRETITPWVERYRQHGIAGLADPPRPGRPRHLDPDTMQAVEAALEQGPAEPECPAARWTLARLRTQFLSRARQAFGRETLRRRLHEAGFRWRRPRLWAHSEDPESFEKQLLIETAQQEAAARPEELHFLYADASDHHLLAVIRSMWQRLGQQVRIATPPRNGHWALFGSLKVATGQFLWQAYEKAESTSFLAFLEYLLLCYPTGTILLTVDNARYHTSKAVVAWLKQQPRILLLYLPARQPQLNPVEKIWAALKDAVSANRSFAHLLALGQFIRAFFDTLTPARALSLAGLRYDFYEAT
jgi:transposase